MIAGSPSRASGFPLPAGILDRDAALAYRARARRPDSTDDYTALVGSLYFRAAAE